MANRLFIKGCVLGVCRQISLVLGLSLISLNAAQSGQLRAEYYETERACLHLSVLSVPETIVDKEKYRSLVQKLMQQDHFDKNQNKMNMNSYIKNYCYDDLVSGKSMFGDLFVLAKLDEKSGIISVSISFNKISFRNQKAEPSDFSPDIYLCRRAESFDCLTQSIIEYVNKTVGRVLEIAKTQRDL